MNSVISQEFRVLSARLGTDPLQVQGPGGNTSIKLEDRMWIKASGTELADALEKNIFVEVDRHAAKAEIFAGGDGSCNNAIIDKSVKLRPSIETTFHAFLNWKIVAHTHSVSTIAHAISKKGVKTAKAKLGDLSPVFIPYRKPGLPLTKEIVARTSETTKVIVLENHGLICGGNSVDEVSNLISEVEKRLTLSKPDLDILEDAPSQAIERYTYLPEISLLAFDDRLYQIATTGSYYPDHVVFLGHALPTSDANMPVAFIRKGQGVFVRTNANRSQRAMLQCMYDVIIRLPQGWDAQPIGDEAEAELLDWDAERYRQALSKGN